MKRLIITSGFLLLLSFFSMAQKNITAWYAKGQVWIVWDETLPRPEVYEVYSSVTPFTSTNQATRIGKLFHWEWAAGAIRDQINDSTFNWKVPLVNGKTRKLRDFQGLFVFTPQATDSLYLAVVKRGDTLATRNVNCTAQAISFIYDPLNDPITCHKQLSSLRGSGHQSTFWAMWADGRQDQWKCRADFPVMANEHKNGQPSIFIVSEAIGMDTKGRKKVPASLWLHGGEGKAIQSLPTNRPTVNIEPNQGILVAHNDDFVAYAFDSVIEQPSNSWFFGWAKNKDPYSKSGLVVEGDTIVNYTQRRIEWINDWLIKNYAVDPERIHINGHSMGSAGTTALLKAYPERYATGTIFNNGLSGHTTEDQGFTLFGNPAWNNPTTLYRRDGSNVGITQAFNLNDRNSTQRDLPLIRMFHGKNDDRGIMLWDAYVVSEYKKADSLGWGMQLYWSERAHGIETGIEWNDHWTHSVSDTGQTVRDNVSCVEKKYTNKSFPGFYNHRLDPAAHDPGDGTGGILSDGGNGDDWGTWGGYHDWNTTTLIDSIDKWQVCSWLTDSAIYRNDNCPDDLLTASLSIRRPQLFKPSTGTAVYWTAIDSTTNIQIKEGLTIVKEDDLVSIDSIVLQKYPKKTYITFSLIPPAHRLALHFSETDYMIYPNPAQQALTILFTTSAASRMVLVKNHLGDVVMTINAIAENSIIDISSLKSGIYFMHCDGKNKRFIKN